MNNFCLCFIKISSCWFIIKIQNEGNLKNFVMSWFLGRPYFCIIYENMVLLPQLQKYETEEIQIGEKPQIQLVQQVSGWVKFNFSSFWSEKYT